jgi:transcriptional regulator of acetoin/glycerol metabolism
MVPHRDSSSASSAFFSPGMSAGTLPHTLPHTSLDQHAGAVPATGWSAQERIAQSHERSKTFGLTVSMQPDYGVLRATDLALKLDHNRELCSHAFPVMETLYEQIVNTHSMVVLTDADGLILHSLGDDDFLARADKVALRAGALWSEQQQGTNAIGTTIAERDATTVCGDQHYLRVNQFLACSSVPILDPFGQLMGVLDVTGDCRSHHRHTLALAKMSAQMIENHLFTNAFPEALRIHFHSRPEFIGTLMEGIAAFAADGRFLSANRSAQFQLGMPLAGLHAHTLSSLFDLSSGQLIDRVRSGIGHQIFSLCLHSGVNVFANIEFRRSNLMTSCAAADGQACNPGCDPGRDPACKPAYRAPQPESKLSGLRYLETGDVQVAALLERVRKVMGKSIPILIGGETGTGKEVLASAIHRDSPSHRGPFVAVDCAAIPDSLIEAELFGYAPGAFTGAAKRGNAGRIMQANGGTLFLDEIGDMPYALQSRLLRVLQERSVTALGSSKPVPVEFALICATNRNLRKMVAAGAFREDLYYRINGLQVTLPPLRERTDLASTVEKILRAEPFVGRPVAVAPEVLALFARHRWPGNFRQLANVLRTACAMLDDHESPLESTIKTIHLPLDFLEELEEGVETVTRSRAASLSAPSHPASASAGMSLGDLTAAAVSATLAAHDGNVSAAARSLGVSRNTLYRKMAALPKPVHHCGELG